MKRLSLDLDLVEQGPHLDHEVLIHPHFAVDLEPVLGRVDREMELLRRDRPHGDRIALGPLDGQDLRGDRLQLLQQLQRLLRIVEDPRVVAVRDVAEQGDGLQNALGLLGLFLEMALGLKGLVPDGLDQMRVAQAGREGPLRLSAQRQDDHLGLQALVEALQPQVGPAVRLDDLGLRTARATSDWIATCLEIPCSRRRASCERSFGIATPSSLRISAIFRCIGSNTTTRTRVSDSLVMQLAAPFRTGPGCGSIEMHSRPPLGLMRTSGVPRTISTGRPGWSSQKTFGCPAKACRVTPASSW